MQVFYDQIYYLILSFIEVYINQYLIDESSTRDEEDIINYWINYTKWKEDW